MPLLKEIQSTDKGLIGITEDNEEVPLNKPIPNVFVKNGVDLKEIIEEIKSDLRYDTKTYYQIPGNSVSLGNYTVILYNSFKKRG